MTDAVSDLGSMFGGEIISMAMPSEGRAFLELANPAALPQILRRLSDFHHARLITITCVESPAFHELLYHTDCGGAIVTLRVRLWKPDIMMQSAAQANPAAELIEHEISEMFGIEFEGNPRLANMILTDEASKFLPLRSKVSSLETRIDGNLSTLAEHGSTTAPSKRVMKSRSQMGMAENPPLCSISCPAKALAREIAEATGAASRHPGIRKKGDGP
jgi:NADH:ubiquinone oxidoreductase subunit C